MIKIKQAVEVKKENLQSKHKETQAHNPQHQVGNNDWVGVKYVNENSKIKLFILFTKIELLQKEWYINSFALA